MKVSNCGHIAEKVEFLLATVGRAGLLTMGLLIRTCTKGNISSYVTRIA